jgi:hypothetical protein
MIDKRTLFLLNSFGAFQNDVDSVVARLTKAEDGSHDLSDVVDALNMISTALGAHMETGFPVEKAAILARASASPAQDEFGRVILTEPAISSRPPAGLAE